MILTILIWLILTIVAVIVAVVECLAYVVLALRLTFKLLEWLAQQTIGRFR